MSIVAVGGLCRRLIRLRGAVKFSDPAVTVYGTPDDGGIVKIGKQ